MTFEEYEKNALSTAIYPGQGEPLGLAYVALKMNGEAGEFAEHLGKSMRDDGFGVDTNQFTNSRKELLQKELGDVLWYLAAGAKELGTSLSEVAQKNNEKLAKRLAEGKLKGSGDNR
jgi:NTP pyrophosphatase (non-canonical NTP hydrolase)